MPEGAKCTVTYRIEVFEDAKIVAVLPCQRLLLSYVGKSYTKRLNFLTKDD